MSNQPQSPAPAQPQAQTPAPDLDVALTRMLEQAKGVSDVNFTVGKPAQMEVSGELRPFAFMGNAEPLSIQALDRIASVLVGDDENLRDSLQKTGACDCAFALRNGVRFRVNVFKARGHWSVVLRALPSEVPSLDKLGLPEALAEIPQLRNGMALVTGATGSGKSTTLAAIIDRINSTRAVHIVTLEDPIEFSHPHKMGTINQREQGKDFRSFADGLKSALRQAPKVILVGEMRDRETVEIGLKAAETGHLVLSTLHTVDAGQTINRIVGLFEAEERQLVRSRLSQVLRFVVGQRLLPREGGGRVAALEIMGSSLRVRELIQSGESTDKTFYQVIADSRPQGWQTFDQHILEHFVAGTVSIEVARSCCSDIAFMNQELDRIRNLRGEQTSDLGQLEMATPQRGRR